MRSLAAAATASSMRTMPSTIEYSLCNRKCTNPGALMRYNFTRLRTADLPRKEPMNRTCARAALAVLMVQLASCASVVQPPVSPPIAPVEAAPAPPPPNLNPRSNVNLQGFPLPYRQGYEDGCASLGGTEQKDAARFKSDG